MPRDDGRVTAVIPVKDPDRHWLAWTLDSLNKQTEPVKEAIIVDSSEAPVSVSVDGLSTWVMHRPGTGIGEARRFGVRAASTEYVIEMDEDAVLLRDDYLARAIAELQKDDVAAAGGVVFPIRGNTVGKAISLADRFNPSDLGTHYLVYRTMQKRDGDLYPVRHRGEDITVREELRDSGQISRMTDQGVLKDLPTDRQQMGTDGLFTILSGAAAGVFASVVEDKLGEAVGL